jgi:hypothetical protein
MRLPYLGVLCVAVGVLGTAPTQKPTKDVMTMVDYWAGPTDLATAVQQAAAVVRVRVLSRRNHLLEGSSPRTAYAMEVVEVLKAHPRVASVIEVYRIGGEEDVGDYIRRTVDPDFPDFKINGEFVLFLGWNDVLLGFEVRQGPDGAYELTESGQVETSGKGKLARSEGGKNKEAFLEEIRRLRKQQPD